MVVEVQRVVRDQIKVRMDPRKKMKERLQDLLIQHSTDNFPTFPTVYSYTDTPFPLTWSWFRSGLRA